MGHPQPFLFIFGLFKQTLQFLQQICVKKYPSSIWCQDLNPWPLERESLPITTRPGLPPYLPFTFFLSFFLSYPLSLSLSLFSSSFVSLTFWHFIFRSHLLFRWEKKRKRIQFLFSTFLFWPKWNWLEVADSVWPDCAIFKVLFHKIAQISGDFLDYFEKRHFL